MKYILLITAILNISFIFSSEVTDLAFSKDYRKGLTVCLGNHTTEDLETVYKKRGFVVSTLFSDKKIIEELRKSLDKKDIYGKVAVNYFNGKSLPLNDNTANLLLVSDFEKLKATGLTLKELFRILAPYGTLIFKASKNDAEKLFANSAKVEQTGHFVSIVKNYPKDMDHWKQDFHDVARTRTSKDKVVAPSTGVQWISLDEMYDSTQKMYSCNGRFAYLDVKNVSRLLSVRDAFNGIKLWDKVVAGPIIMHDDLIFSIDQKSIKFTSYKASNGETVKEYDFGKEFLDQWRKGSHNGDITIYEDMFILKNGHEARNIKTGELLWKTKYADLGGKKIKGWMVQERSQISNVIGGGKIFTIQNKEKILCIDAKTGKIEWETKIKKKNVLSFYHKGYLFITNKQMYTAYLVSDGKQAWTYKLAKRPNKNILFYPKGENVVVGRNEQVPEWAVIADTLDVKTGEVLDSQTWEKGAVSGCFDKVKTEKYILGGRFSTVSVEDGKTDNFYAAMAECGSSSLLPANGLVYQVFSRVCGCYAHINKATAFSSVSLENKIKKNEGERLNKGSEYGKVKSIELLETDWNTYRKDNKRSAFSNVSIKESFAQKWELNLKHKISAPVVSNGTVFVSLPLKNKVIAIDGKSGKQKWEYIVGAKVDSPPTIYNNMAIFGCRDGKVYCLNASNGKLVWSFMAAKGINIIQCENGIESLWPVPGSILVNEGIAYFASGRHTHSDGGLDIYAIKCDTGEIVWQKKLDGLYEDPKIIARTSVHSKKGKPIPRKYEADDLPMRTQKNDIMLASGNRLYLYNQELNIKTGELIHERTEAVMFSGGMGFLGESSSPPYYQKHGRKAWRFRGYRANILATDGKRLIGSVIYYDRNADEFRAYRGADIYKAAIFYDHQVFGIRDVDAEVNIKYGKGGGKQVETPEVHWSNKLKKHMIPRAFILTKENFIMTSISHSNLDKKGKFNERTGNAYEGVDSEKSTLSILSADSGKEIFETKINCIPSHDGMALADGKLYLTTIDGKIICFE